MILNGKKTKPKMSIALCPCNSRYVKRNEERANRWMELIGKDKTWILAYDLVLLAKYEESIKEIMRRLKRYLEDKNLQLDTEKSKTVF